MTKEEHVKHLLEDPVYAIMGNEELCLGRSNMDVAKELIAAGVTIIQYREKHKKWRAKYEEAKAIAQLCHDHNVTFIMNDSTDLAIACGADGIHVGQDDAPAQIVRQLAGPDVFIGVSTNTIDEMKQALADGADYVGFGPMFPTKSSRRKPKPMHCTMNCPSSPSAASAWKTSAASTTKASAPSP